MKKVTGKQEVGEGAKNYPYTCVEGEERRRMGVEWRPEVAGAGRNRRRKWTEERQVNGVSGGGDVTSRVSTRRGREGATRRPVIG